MAFDFENNIKDDVTLEKQINLGYVLKSIFSDFIKSYGFAENTGFIYDPDNKVMKFIKNDYLPANFYTRLFQLLLKEKDLVKDHIKYYMGTNILNFKWTWICKQNLSDFKDAIEFYETFKKDIENSMSQMVITSLVKPVCSKKEANLYYKLISKYNKENLIIQDNIIHTIYSKNTTIENNINILI